LRGRFRLNMNSPRLRHWTSGPMPQQLFASCASCASWSNLFGLGFCHPVSPSCLPQSSPRLDFALQNGRRDPLAPDFGPSGSPPWSRPLAAASEPLAIRLGEVYAKRAERSQGTHLQGVSPRNVALQDPTLNPALNHAQPSCHWMCPVRSPKRMFVPTPTSM
jgi:hypothetical protein